MKIKIIKSSDPFFWYSDKIGQVFEVKNSETDSECYDVINSEQEGFEILKSDCHIV